MEILKKRVMAAAKINLFLDVTGRRDNGYHTINSIMHTVSLSDTVDIEVDRKGSGRITLTCSDKSLPTGEKNLAYRAAAKFLSETGLSLDVSINIDKHIPMAAGLAGGSADAAAVFRGLNSLCGEYLPEDELCRIGSRLGADIPFCIVGGSCAVSGIGEILEYAPPMPECTIVIACAGEGVSTPAAYGALDAAHGNFALGAYTEEREKYGLLKASLEGGNILGTCENMFNLFEEVILPERPVARRIKEILEESGAMRAMMSGSGPSVFGIFEKGNTERIKDAVLSLEKEGIVAHICEPIYKL